MQEMQVPQPKSKVVNYNQIKTVDQALDYAMGGYHASFKSSHKEGPIGRLWEDSAMAYYAAYLAISPLAALPGEQALPKALELLKDANHKADLAAASAKTA
jgi:hypothetical protein